MKTIWKYALLVADRQELQMPTGANFLAVQVQREEICLWALVDTDNPLVGRRIHTYGTGQGLGELGTYIGTYQLRGGGLVFHVFEERRSGLGGDPAA